MCFHAMSHFKDCVAMVFAMCLIVALYFPFLIEVYMLVALLYSILQCKITQLEKQDNWQGALVVCPCNIHKKIPSVAMMINFLALVKI